MKTTSLIFAVLLSLVRFASAQAADNSFTDSKPLPTMDFLLQKVVARATNNEDNNDYLFDMNYQYTRTRTWEYRNASGELSSSNSTSRVENKPQRLAAKALRLSTMNQPMLPARTGKNTPAANGNSSIQGKALKVKDYSIPNLVSRFQFTLVGRELLNGRPSLVVDFKPLNDHLPVNQFADNFINKAAGRVWIDEQDYAVAQAQLHLTQPVNVLGGIVGAVQKFTYEFTRVRTPEGYWFARNMDWHVEGREVVVNRIVDYHEQKLNEQKIGTAGAAAR
jgi:hypothetical protein